MMDPTHYQSMGPDPRQRDNSRFWIAGIFYVNPDDPRLLVEKRSGLGWTFNFAHPLAWWLTIGLFALLALLQLILFINLHNTLTLVLMFLSLFVCILLVAGYLRVRAGRQ